MRGFSGVYFLLMIVLNSVATVVSSLVIMLQRRGEYNRDIPSWARTIFFNFLGQWLRIRPPKGLRVERFRRATKRDKAVFEPLIMDRFLNNALDSALLRSGQLLRGQGRRPQGEYCRPEGGGVEESPTHSGDLGRRPGELQGASDLSLRQVLLRNLDLLSEEIRKIDLFVRVRNIWESVQLNSTPSHFFHQIDRKFLSQLPAWILPSVYEPRPRVCLRGEKPRIQGYRSKSCYLPCGTSHRKR